MKRLTIDILMLIIMLLEMSRVYTGALLHEILGVTLLILLVIHLYLNRNYLFNIFKTGYNLKNILMLIVNILLMILFVLTILFGLLSSQELFEFLNIGSLEVIRLHKIISYITFLIIGLHLGLNLIVMVGKFTNKFKNKKINTLISVIIIVGGIYSFIKVDFYNHLIGEYGFGTNTNGFIINLMEYLFILLGLAIVTNFIYKKIRGRKYER